jgi:chromosome partitioning protein
MRRILVLNTKGGCGKTTIATNLASLYASRGLRTALFDYDPQGSSTSWLEQRPDNLPAIHGVRAAQANLGSLTRSWQLRVPPETERVIIDTPAGLDRSSLLEQLRGIDNILVPITPSAIDIRAAAYFIQELLLTNRVTRARVGIVANRVRENALSLQALERFLTSLHIPIIARLRDTQNYVRAAEAGAGVHELELYNARTEMPRWRKILDWLETEPAKQPRPAQA